MSPARPESTHRWLSAGSALLAGLLSVLAFAPFGWFWIAPLCMMALFWLVRDASPRRAVLLGLAYGIGQFGAGTYWILIALSGVGGAPLSLALALLVGLVFVLALFPAVTLAAAARLAPASRTTRLLLWLPLFWTLIEWLRSWLFSGFPWLSIGYSQIMSPLIGFAPIFGVFGVSLVVALSAGLLAWLVDRCTTISPGMGRGPMLALAGLLALWAGGFGLAQIGWTQPSGPQRSVALVQGDIDQQAKWSQEAVNSAIKRYSELTHGHWHNDLVVWPETAIPDYYYAVKPALDDLGQQLAAHHTTLLTGLLSVKPGTRDIYNSVVAVGASRGIYHKRHLVPFGEYFPVPDFIRRWMAESGMAYADFTPGPADPRPISASNLSLGLSICYEDIFGALIARDVPPAGVLVNVSDDAWFGRSIGPEQHFEMARMRAVETGRYLVRADNSAVTGIVGPHGRVLKRAPAFEPAVVTGQVRAYTGLTPYVRWRDWGLIGLLGLIAALTLAIQYFRNRRSTGPG